MTFSEVEIGYIKNALNDGISHEVIAKTLGRRVKTVTKFIDDNGLNVEPDPQEKTQKVERSTKIERSLSQMRSGPAIVMTAGASQKADAHYERLSTRTTKNIDIDRPKG